MDYVSGQNEVGPVLLFVSLWCPGQSVAGRGVDHKHKGKDDAGIAKTIA